MTADGLISIRELDSRLTDGIQVRLLWNPDGRRVWVSVLNTRSGYRFNVGVYDGEQPLDVFNHPFAYAAHHGVEADALRPCPTPVETWA